MIQNIKFSNENTFLDLVKIENLFWTYVRTGHLSNLFIDNECKPCPGTPGSDCTNCDDTPYPSFEPPCEEGNKPGLCSGNQARKNEVEEL